MIQVRIESELGTKLWTHQDRIDNGVFSLTLPEANALDTECNSYLTIVLIVYSFSVSELKPSLFI